MTILVRGEKSYFFGSRAELIDDAKEVAAAADWAAEHIVPNRNLKWVLGRYVEADKANNNRQYWTLDDLLMSEPTITHAPMNMLHQKNHIVGSIVGSKLLYPTDAEEEAGVAANPYIETLGAFWKHLFPQDLELVEKAHNEGALFWSMECDAETVTFVDQSGDTETFPYMGPQHASYGSWNQKDYQHRQLNKPHFLGAALIIPPVKPGWSHADIKEISKYMEDNSDQAQQVYNEIKSEAGHLSEKELEGLTMEFLSKAVDMESLENNSITNTELTNSELADEVVVPESVQDNTNVPTKEGGDDVAKTYTEEELAAMVSELAELRDEVKTLKGKDEEAAVQAKIDELTEQYNKEVADLQTQLDQAVLDAEEAKKAKDVIVNWLEDEAKAADEAAQAETRTSERIAAVAEVASFPADYVETNKTRWSEMSDEAFDAYLEGLKTRQEEKAAEETSEVETPIAETAMAATTRSDTAAASSTNVRKEVFEFRKSGINPRNF